MNKRNSDQSGITHERAVHALCGRGYSFCRHEGSDVLPEPGMNIGVEQYILERKGEHQQRKREKRVHAVYECASKKPRKIDFLLIGEPGEDSPFNVYDGRQKIWVECKSQQGSGSTDQKLPLVFRQFQILDADCLLLLGGDWFADGKPGWPAVQWATEECAVFQSQTGRHVEVIHINEFYSKLPKWFGLPGEKSNAIATPNRQRAQRTLFLG